MTGQLYMQKVCYVDQGCGYKPGQKEWHLNRIRTDDVV